MLDVFTNEIKQYGYMDAIVHHIHSPNEAMAYAATIASIAGKTPQVIPIGAVIGTHVGPGTLGIAYRTHKPMR